MGELSDDEQAAPLFVDRAGVAQAGGSSTVVVDFAGEGAVLDEA